MNLKPYPRYKAGEAGWLNEIPASWVMIPLKALATCNDEVLSEHTDPDYHFRYLEISDVSHTGGITFNEPIAFASAPSRARRVVREGDVLVSTVRTYLRAISGARSVPADTIASTGFAVLRPNMCDARFLAYGLLAEHAIGAVIARSVGISYPAINATDLVHVKIPVPSHDEQQKIADFLDRETAEIDAFIADQEQLIALLAERRTATITHAVTKGLNPDVQMKDSGVEWIGEVPRSWSTRKLSWLSRIGNGSTPSSENPEFWTDGSIPWLNSSCVNLDIVTEPSKYVTHEALKDCHLPMVPKGSLLIGLTGQGKTRGMVTRLAIASTINQHIAYLTPSPAMSALYAHWFLAAAYDELRFISDGNGGTKGGLTCDQLGRVRIPLPNLSEQLRIVAYLDRETTAIDSAVADAREAIALSKERRAALISAAVTGKIDVRGLGASASMGEAVSVGVA